MKELFFNNFWSGKAFLILIRNPEGISNFDKFNHIYFLNLYGKATRSKVKRQIANKKIAIDIRKSSFP